MFYYLSQLPEQLSAQGHAGWADWLSGLRVFQYITFRAAGAAVTALLLSLWLGPLIIRWLRGLRVRQEYEDRAREMGDLKSDGISKVGVPTMGGLLIVGVLDLTALLWAQWNPLVTLTLLAVLVLCLLGFYDDYSKISSQQSNGIAGKVKLAVQFALALFIGVYLWKLPVVSEVFMACNPKKYPLVNKYNFSARHTDGQVSAAFGDHSPRYELAFAEGRLMRGKSFKPDGTESGRVEAGEGRLALYAPGGKKEVEQIYHKGVLVQYKTWVPHNLVSSIMLPFNKRPVLVGAGLLGVLLAVLAIVGSSNAVNLTDGLDGLAIGSTVIVSMVFLMFTYIASHTELAAYLNVPHVAGAGELTVVCAALIGASLGFLWFNCHPAQVFMGDTGALAIGGMLGIIAVLIHQPFVLVIAGGVFVLEALSVLLQSGWFKYTRLRTGEGQRIFLMAPLHHHFQKKDWHENQVVIRFYILGVLFAVLALATLKLR